MSENKEKEIYTRKLTVPKTVNEENRTISAVIASENPVRIYDYQNGFVDEVLLMSGMESVDQIPLVDSHRYSSVQQILGSCTGIKSEGVDLVGEISFSSVNQAEFTKTKEGHISKLSIGYEVLEYTIIPSGQRGNVNGKEYIADDKFDLKIVTKWRLLEVSLVALPADESTEFRNKNIQNTNSLNNEERGKNMDEKEVKTEVNAVEITTAERARAKEIRSAGRALDISEDVIDNLIDSGTDLSTARAKLIEEAGKNLKFVNSSVSVQKDESDNIREIAPLAIAQRAGIAITKEEAAEVRKSEFGGLGYQGLARTIMVKNGVRGVERMSNDAVATKILSRAMVGVGDFVNILANVATKSLQNAYINAPVTFNSWCGKGSLSDFKQAGIVQLSAFSALAKINEKAAFTDGTFLDSKENAQLETFGRSWIASRQTIIDDDVNALARVPGAMGASAAYTVNAAVYTFIEANGDMSDGKKLFSSDHNNISAAAANPSVTTIGAGLEKMMGQTSNGIKLGILPQYIIVPVSMAVGTEQVISSVYDPAQANGSTINPFSSNGRWRMQLITDPNLANSVWYLAANPNQVGTVTVHYLNGNELPTIRSAESRVSEALGIAFDCFLDFGISGDDYRGLYRNAAVA